MLHAELQRSNHTVFLLSGCFFLPAIFRVYIFRLFPPSWVPLLPLTPSLWKEKHEVRLDKIVNFLQILGKYWLSIGTVLCLRVLIEGGTRLCLF